MNFVLTAHEFKLPGYSQASVQWWIEGRDIYTCNRLCINYPWHHTVIYDCSIPSYKKDTKTAVIEQMDRTFNVESLYHLYSGSLSTLHTKINYSRITCACNKQNMLQVITLCPSQCFFSYSYVLQCHYELDICCSVCILSFPECAA